MSIFLIILLFLQSIMYGKKKKTLFSGKDNLKKWSGAFSTRLKNGIENKTVCCVLYCNIFLLKIIIISLVRDNNIGVSDIHRIQYLFEI